MRGEDTMRRYIYSTVIVAICLATFGQIEARAAELKRPEPLAADANWSSDIRTPLGLVDEGNGLCTLVYTAEWGDFKSVGMVKVKLIQK